MNNLPEDILNLIYKKNFTNDILPLIKKKVLFVYYAAYMVFHVLIVLNNTMIIFI